MASCSGALASVDSCRQRARRGARAGGKIAGFFFFMVYDMVFQAVQCCLFVFLRIAECCFCYFFRLNDSGDKLLLVFF